VDALYFEELHGKLLGLVIGLEGRIRGEKIEWLHEVTRVGEYGLALEDMAAILAGDGIAISSQERAGILALAEKMKMTGKIATWLDNCPQAPDSGVAADPSVGYL
jgi:hypothetical protein